jgi:hypothetical protein
MSIIIQPASAEIDLQSETEGTLTNLARQDWLFEHGFRFEALAAQAFLVEAVLQLYLQGAIDSKRLLLTQRMAGDLETGRLTLGRVAGVLKKAHAYHEPSLSTDVDKYVDYRNLLAHNLAISLDWGPFLEEPYCLGRELAVRLWEQVLRDRGDDPSWTAIQAITEWEEKSKAIQRIKRREAAKTRRPRRFDV